MTQSSRLTLNAAAWFFVGSADDVDTGQSIPIQPPFRIGREPGSDLCLPGSSVSGLHAEILEIDGQLWLRDLKSTNGTFVNGTRIKSKTQLQADDTVQFGTSVFHISNEQDAAENSEFATANLAAAPEPDSIQSVSPNERFKRLLTGAVVPFFQPVVKLANGAHEIVGYEVLGRSQLFGLHTPAQMFAAASKLEMEAELSRELRKQGIKIADKNLPAGHLLFVNTHPAELQCRGLEESLFEIRDNHPDRPIVIEVHESILNDGENYKKIHRALKILNIQLALHDFGSGQIRMAELCELRPDIVKFDVKLTHGINHASAQQQQYVAAMTKMVQELGIQPMAEWVEQADEHAAIEEAGFELGQGFHYGRPGSIEDCTRSETTKNSPQIGSFLTNPGANACPGEPKNAAWLMQQPGHLYSIQVLSAISLERAQDHVAMQSQPEQFAIFSKPGKTRPLYIVVYGLFDDRTTAKSAAAQLTNSTVSPWIRLLSSIHAEIESGR